MSISAISGISAFSGAYQGRQPTSTPTPSANPSPAQPQPTPQQTSAMEQGQPLSSEMIAVLIQQQVTLTGSSSFAS